MTTGASSAIAGGAQNATSRPFSMIAGGFSNVVQILADYGGTLGGEGLRLSTAHSSAVGRFNLDGQIGAPLSNRLFMVGNGTDIGAGRSNAFSVTEDGNARVPGTFFSATAADFAEFFESFDGDSMPAGTSVVFHEGTAKIRSAVKGEIPFGVVSRTACLVGNAADSEWHGKYERNLDGSVVWEVSNEGVRQRKLSEDFDPALPYIPREVRKEWHIIGLVGMVRVLKSQVVDPRWILMRGALPQPKDGSENPYEQYLLVR